MSCFVEEGHPDIAFPTPEHSVRTPILKTWTMNSTAPWKTRTMIQMLLIGRVFAQKYEQLRTVSLGAYKAFPCSMAHFVPFITPSFLYVNENASKIAKSTALEGAIQDSEETTKDL